MGKHHLFVRLGTCTCTRLLAAVLRPHRAPRTSIIDSSPASRNREEGGRDLGAAHALLGVAIDLDLFGTELETRLAILLARKENEGEESHLKLDGAAEKDGAHGLDLRFGVIVIPSEGNGDNMNVIVVVGVLLSLPPQVVDISLLLLQPVLDPVVQTSDLPPAFFTDRATMEMPGMAPLHRCSTKGKVGQ